MQNGVLPVAPALEPASGASRGEAVKPLVLGATGHLRLSWVGEHGPAAHPGSNGISKCLTLIPGGLLSVCIRLGDWFKGLPAVGSAVGNVPFPVTTGTRLYPRTGLFGSGMGFALYGAGACWKGHSHF